MNAESHHATGFRPLIGISTSEVRPAETLRPIREGEPPSREVALGLAYVDALRQAGGIPTVIPPMRHSLIAELLDRVDGICLSGGPDLDPAAYGAPPHPKLGPTAADFDHFELELTRAASRRGTPILAICRGMQTLNVSRGGSLIQHLPEHPGAHVNHRQDEPGWVPGHPIEIDPDSIITRIAGTTKADVNTFHHQAIERLGGGLQAIGWSPDGITEAIEDPSLPFALGVQWHAELAAGRPLESALFGAFINAARAFASPEPRVTTDRDPGRARAEP